MNIEYQSLKDAFDFSIKDFRSLNQLAQEASFIPLEKKQKVRHLFF